jgi:hypothetical protein
MRAVSKPPHCPFLYLPSQESIGTNFSPAGNTKTDKNSQSITEIHPQIAQKTGKITVFYANYGKISLIILGIQ